MARRRVGQETFCFDDPGKCNDLDALSALIDWSQADEIMVDISSAAKGE